MSGDEAIAIDSAPDDSSFSNVFLGLLTAPVETLTHLNDNFANLDIDKQTSHVFNAVFLAMALAGMSYIHVAQGWFSILTVILVLSKGMIWWLWLALSLTVLASLSKTSQMTWKKALTLTGWPFIPLMFYAPLACYKQFFGPLIFLFGFAPILWVTILETQAFRVALNLSTGKAIAAAVILPSLITSAYLFWMFFTGALFLGEVISYFQ